MRLWFLTWTLWAVFFLLALPLMPIFGKILFHENFYFYVLLAIIFLNGLASLAFLSSNNSDLVSSLILFGLYGLAQWFCLYQAGRLWLKNWRSNQWYWRISFPLFLVGYYVMAGSFSVYSFILSVSYP